MTTQPFFIPAIIFILVSIPLIMKWIPRNRFYGIRTKKTLSSDEIWFHSNRFGGILFFLAGIIYLIFAAVFPQTNRTSLTQVNQHFGVFIGSIVLCLVLIWRNNKKL